MKQTETKNNIRLTSLAHGGGCGCKISPGKLQQILKSTPISTIFPQLLVGQQDSDDAAVYQINEQQAIVATTDFFMPIVDDARDFGRIAATNAISDVYAMGGKPIIALAIVAMPIDKLDDQTIGEILAGGASVCADIGIPIAGGHSIDSVEPIYGLVVIGLIEPKLLRKNSMAKAGDVLILTKPLGVGILSAALKKDLLSTEDYQVFINLTTRLNKVGYPLAQMTEVSTLTDVTGFGLAGHLLEILRASKLSANLKWSDLPILERAKELAQQEIFTGASVRNWQSYGAEVSLPNNFPNWKRNILTDPQTSGGLLICCAEEAVEQVLDLLCKNGTNDAQVIGQLTVGPVKINLFD